MALGPSASCLGGQDPGLLRFQFMLSGATRKRATPSFGDTDELVLGYFRLQCYSSRAVPEPLSLEVA